jgi:hypothetical protein
MQTNTLIGVGVAIWLAGAVFSVRIARKNREKRRAGGEDVPGPNLPLAAAIIGFILFSVGMVFGPGVLAERRDTELRQTGTAGTAKITAVDETGNVFNGSAEVQVTVLVEPEGGQPFESQSTWIFSITDVQKYEVGTQVDVFFDPVDHETVAIVGVAASNAAAE